MSECGLMYATPSMVESAACTNTCCPGVKDFKGVALVSISLLKIQGCPLRIRRSSPFLRRSIDNVMGVEGSVGTPASQLNYEYIPAGVTLCLLAKELCVSPAKGLCVDSAKRAVRRPGERTMRRPGEKNCASSQ